MIVNFIYNSIFSLINFIIGILPSMEILPDEFTQAWNFLGNAIKTLSSVNDIMPTLLTILGWFIVIETAFFTYEIVNWSYNKLRGSG